MTVDASQKLYKRYGKILVKAPLEFQQAEGETTGEISHTYWTPIVVRPSFQFQESFLKRSVPESGKPMLLLFAPEEEINTPMATPEAFPIILFSTKLSHVFWTYGGLMHA